MKPVAKTGALVLALIVLLSPALARAAVLEVTVGDNFFSPAELTIQPGDTVRWINAAGGNAHNVTSNDGAFAASGTSSSFTFEVVFNDPGSFSYFCTLHPSQMQGTITVEGAVASPELALLSVNAENGSFAPGSMIAIDTSIANSGDADSGAFTINFYASTNNNITTSDTLIGSANVANVAQGDTLQRQDTVTLPESLAPGEWFIGAILSLDDGNGANNTNVDTTTITVLAAFLINAGLNDAWVSDDAPLQGFFITVFPDIGLVFLSWFTFDSVLPTPPDTAVFGAFDQRWVTASGFYSGDTVDLNVELTTGGVFNAADPLATQDPAYGTMTIVFVSCNEAILTYNFPSLGLSGQITLTRVVPDNVPLCETLNAGMQAAR